MCDLSVRAQSPFAECFVIFYTENRTFVNFDWWISPFKVKKLMPVVLCFPLEIFIRRS